MGRRGFRRRRSAREEKAAPSLAQPNRSRLRSHYGSAGSQVEELQNRRHIRDEDLASLSKNVPRFLSAKNELAEELRQDIGILKVRLPFPRLDGKTYRGPVLTALLTVL